MIKQICFNTPSTSRLQKLGEVRFVAPALRPQFCLHYNSGLVWPQKTWLAGRIASFALLVVELCPVAYRATAGANFAAFPTYQQRLHWLRAPNNTCLSRPDPPTLSLRRLGDPGHRPARQDGAGTAGDGRGTAERDRKSAAALGLAHRRHIMASNRALAHFGRPSTFGRIASIEPPPQHGRLTPTPWPSR